VLHGLRFTAPSLQVHVASPLKMPQFWPSTTPLVWPSGARLDDAGFLDFVGGKEIHSTEPHIELRPWRPAVELAPSEAVDGLVELPMICGKHVAYYPAVLVNEAMHGRFYAFATACDCPTAYLVHTAPEGAHCKAADTPEVISALYERSPGEEYEIADANGAFICKRVPASAATPDGPC
jgi:hypothetical protein